MSYLFYKKRTKSKSTQPLRKVDPNPLNLWENPLFTGVNPRVEQKPTLEKNSGTAVDLAPPLSKVEELVDGS